MKKLSEYILEAKENNLKEFKKELEKVIDSKFNDIEPFNPGRMESMLNKEQFKENIDTIIKDLCNKYNVFIASTDEDDVIGGCIRVSFESAYGEKINLKSDLCFHLTDNFEGDKIVQEIMKNGLKPMKAFRTFKMKQYHPDRIYLLSGEVSKEKIKQYKGQLCADGVIIVDLKKLKKEYGQTLEFWKDPQSFERVSLYTDEPIRKEVLSYMSWKDFIKSEIFDKLPKY